MDWVIILGSTCMGIAMGWLVRYLLERIMAFDVKALGAVVPIIIGAVMLGFFQLVGGVHGITREFFFYPVGLILGVFIPSLLAASDGQPPSNPPTPN